MAVGDVNNDGRLDLVVAGFMGGAVLLLGNGDGSFQEPRPIIAGGTYFAALGDFNGDGLLDVAVAFGASSDRVSVLLGPGDGSFQAPRGFLAGGARVSIARGRRTSPL